MPAFATPEPAAEPAFPSFPQPEPLPDPPAQASATPYLDFPQPEPVVPDYPQPQVAAAPVAPEPEPELFVPLHIPSSGGGAHGGGAPVDPGPEPELFTPIDVPDFSGEKAAAAEPALTPSGLPLPGALPVPPPPGGRSGPPRWMVGAGVGVLVLLALLAGVTLLGKEVASADGAYAACVERVGESAVTEQGELEFQPEERAVVEQSPDGVAVEIWAEDDVSRAFFRCDVDTSAGEPRVEKLWIDLSESIDQTGTGRGDADGEFDSVGNSISG
jgi:hypothetical protein